jgi:hypothetical protein
MGQGDIPTSRGGPLRRRREKRQLEHLAEESDREVTPGTDRTHVRVLEDNVVAEKPPAPAPLEQEPSERPPDAIPEVRTGFHVRAVPIDQPFDE